MLLQRRMYEFLIAYDQRSQCCQWRDQITEHPDLACIGFRIAKSGIAVDQRSPGRMLLRESRSCSCVTVGES